MKVYGEALMLRRLFTIARMALLGLCLVLALAAAVLWVRKATRQDQFSYAREGGRLWVAGSRANGLYVTIVSGWPNHEPPRLYSLDEPGQLIGPQIGVSRGPIGRGSGWENGLVDPGRVLATPSTQPAQLGVGPGAPFAAPRAWKGNVVLAPRASLTPPIFEVFVPHWMPLALFAIPPLAWGSLRWRRSAVRRRRTRQGECLACGYDLRASSGRCPECGREDADRVILQQPA
jgi:hypothetical protein